MAEGESLKVLGLCGSHKMDKQESVSWYLLQQALEAVSENGVEVDAVHLSSMNIYRCQGCSRCMGGGECPLLSRDGDETLSLVEMIRSSDALIFSFPVYGLHAANATTDFIGGRAKPFLGEELVVSGKENLGKSSLFRGKMGGLIANGGGYGMEMAFVSLWPALFASKAIPVACAGVSTFEYQKVDFIENTPISKKIEDTEWARNISRSVGQRVYDALHSQARYIIEGMMGIRRIKDDDELGIVTDKLGLKWDKSGREEFEKIPVFAREVALKMIAENIGKLGYDLLTKEAIIEGRKRFAPGVKT
ncbi:MAG: hypothetical protein GF344_08100 [Chitinivibrionales bacterium]|nr:hypothetical protein [Chitinivibrionales bacterium]